MKHAFFTAKDEDGTWEDHVTIIIGKSNRPPWLLAQRNQKPNEDINHTVGACIRRHGLDYKTHGLLRDRFLFNIGF